MWSQNYTPIAGSLGFSSLAAAIPIFCPVVFVGLPSVSRRGVAALSSGLAAAVAVAIFEYGMPAGAAFGAIGYGAANGLFPIGWVVFTAILLYRITVEMGTFEILKDSVGNLSQDRRLQALLIAFAFGAFIEGAAGFGTPVCRGCGDALHGLGFSPFYAAGICLLANTAPVAFGSIGIPIITLRAITNLPLDRLSAGVGRICAPISLFVPAYLIMVMGGWPALRGVLPAAALCGAVFAGTQFFVSNFIGPELTDILASLAAIGSLIILFKLWKPKDTFQLPGEHAAEAFIPKKHPAGRRGLQSPGLSLPVVGGIRSGMGRQTRQGDSRIGDRQNRLARIAQPRSPDAAADRAERNTLLGGLQLQLAFGCRHVMPVRGDSFRAPVGNVPRTLRAHVRRHSATKWRCRN